MRLLWYMVCFSCLGLNLVGLVGVPLQHPPWPLQVGGLHPRQGRGLEEDKEQGILVKTEDKAAPNVELGGAERLTLGHHGPGVSVEGAPPRSVVALCWKAAPFRVMERNRHF